MSGQQSFHNRVTIPLVVILATVGGLAIVGTFLWGLGTSSNSASSEPTAVVSNNPSATDTNVPVPIDSANPATSPTAIVIPEGVTAVSVFNGTQVAGLAKTTADKLKAGGWTIKEVGNWQGAGLAKTTVFYPKALEGDAQKLADEMKADFVEADSTLPQDVLTLVVMG
jgi:hypothetical protein